MYRIALLNVPFANVKLPSIATAQLKFVTEEAHGGNVEVRTFELNHDFSEYLGHDRYDELLANYKHFVSGLGDWLFRQAAFPDAPDNAGEYFTRYYPRGDAASLLARDVLLAKRAGVPDFLRRTVAKYGLDRMDLVGLTSMFSQNTACFAIARAIKEANPQVCVVMGGANCEYPMGLEIAAHVDAVDYVFSGPALVSFPAFVGTRLRGEPAGEPIAGVFSKADAGRQRDAQGAPSIGAALDINHRIPLDYDAFMDSFERFFPNSPTGPSLLFETSRGCWWGEKSHCTFCGLNGLSMTYKSMAPPLALELIQSLFRYAPRGVREFQCVDNILPKSYVRDVFPHLNTPQTASIFYEVKADLSEDDVRVLAAAHVFRIQPGIEALASSTLKLMRKGTTAFINLTLLKLCRAYGITPEWNLLVGFPGETEAVFEKYTKDVPLLTHLQPPAGVATVRFDRFSPYFNNAQSYGLRLQPYDFYGMIYPFPAASLERMAFYFTDQNDEADYFVDMITWLDDMQKAVNAWRRRWSRGPDERPRLEFRAEDGREVVYDSRGSVPVTRALSDSALALLRHLRAQSSLERLETAFAAVPRAALHAEIAGLRRYGLIFEEGDRLMSLVVDPPRRPQAREPERELVGAAS
jgi:magnesium-protoporphyrin IX monomethyl ester (oxidative) cyclase